MGVNQYRCLKNGCLAKLELAKWESVHTRVGKKFGIGPNNSWQCASLVITGKNGIWPNRSWQCGSLVKQKLAVW